MVGVHLCASRPPFCCVSCTVCPTERQDVVRFCGYGCNTEPLRSLSDRLQVGGGNEWAKGKTSGAHCFSPRGQASELASHMCPVCASIPCTQGLASRVRKYTSGTPPIIQEDFSINLEAFTQVFGTEGHPMELFPYMWRIGGWRTTITSDGQRYCDARSEPQGALVPSL